MKLLLFQYDDRIFNHGDVRQKLMKHNEDICKKNNIIYKFSNVSKHDISCYWIKVFDTYDVLVENPNIDYIIFLDTDACIISPDVTNLIDIITKSNIAGCSMIINDAPISDNYFNAGAFIVKNNEIGINILKKWKSFYNIEKWFKKNGKFVTNKNKGCRENKKLGTISDLAYEEVPFRNYILLNEEFSNHIYRVDDTVFNSIKITEKTVVYHGRSQSMGRNKIWFDNNIFNKFQNKEEITNDENQEILL